jgi:geranylgeranyl pyrophosphate synthase
MSSEQAGVLQARIAEYQARSERMLEACLPDDAAIARLCEAMRYSVLGGGKRLRPVLVYTTGVAFGAPLERLDAPAAAVELIHAYSLIHDDLPAMDDDDLRRGKPSCHRAFDEGTAILAGDALQALAFEVLAGEEPASAASGRASQDVLMLKTLALAIGPQGMAGGQAIDLAAIGTQLGALEIERMHRRKTGALIQASIDLGAIAAGLALDPIRVALRLFGTEIGLAFQIHDDILDVTGETGTLGKRQGADAAHGKPTYPSVFGLAAARSLAARHRDRALEALEPLGSRVLPLRELARYVTERAH